MNMEAEMNSLHRPSNERACSHRGAGALVVMSTVLLLFTLLDGANGFSPPLASKMTPYNCKRSALSGRYFLKAQRKYEVSLAATSVKDADSKDASKNVVRIYKDYATRLWNETNPLARERIAQDKAAAAVKQVEHIMIGEEYVPFSEESEEARKQLLVACQNMLKVMDDKSRTDDKAVMLESTNETSAVLEEATIDEKAPAKATKPRRSILFGAAMGAIVACWVFSGNYIFTGLFTLMTILGQLEYYRMVMNTGIYPARRISIVGACSMFLTVSLYCAMFP
jgi:hypothetical protein